MNPIHLSRAAPRLRTTARRAAPWAVAGLAMVIAAFTGATGAVDTGAVDTRAAAATVRHDPKLTRAAVVRDQEDGRATVLPLLARYDRMQDERALREALRWFDRQWEAGDGRALAYAQPLHARVCPHPQLQWSWLCESGE